MAVLVGVSVGGLVLLAIAADRFVDAAGRIAVRLNASQVVVGIFIVGFGTSSPELVVSLLAALDGAPDIAIGNVVGSNVANLTLVLGGASILSARPLQTRLILDREVPLSSISVILLGALLLGGLVRIEAALLLAAMIAAAFLLLRGGGESDAAVPQHPRRAADRPARFSVEIPRLLVGLTGILLGSRLVVAGAEAIADELALAEGFVGFTLVAIGTSLPEVVTGIQAARRDEMDLVVGNVLGSNLFNSLAIAGMVGLVAPTSAQLIPAVVLMVAFTAVTWISLATGHRLSRREGVLLLGIYVVSLPVLAALTG